MTELGFLLELLLNHKLPKATRVAVTERVKEVEGRLGARPVALAPIQNVPPQLANQSPSTIAAMMKHPDLVQGMAVPPPPPAPVENIAQTPATAAALASRQAAIQEAMSGKPEKGRTSPRKF